VHIRLLLVLHSVILFVEMFYFAAKLKGACATPPLFWHLEWQCIYETQAAEHVWLLYVRRHDDVQWWNSIVQLTEFLDRSEVHHSLLPVWNYQLCEGLGMNRFFQRSMANFKFLDARWVTQRTFLYWGPASIRYRGSKFSLQDNLTPGIFAAAWRLFLNTSSLRDTSIEIFTLV